MDSTKIYLMSALVNGIEIVHDPHCLMVGLVSFINHETERMYHAIGDEDGVIIHNARDEPFLSVIYSKSKLKFNSLGSNQFYHDEIGLALLNIVAYLRELGTEFNPVGFSLDQQNHLNSKEDWSL